MKTLAFTLLASTLLLQSCGDDASSGGRRDNNTPTNQTQAAEPEAEGSAISSPMFRVRGKAYLTYAQEIEATINGTLSENSRPVPSILIDDEGKHQGSVLTRTGLGRPSVACGNGRSFTGIEGRIADCATKNGEKATWVGSNEASQGEGTWNLVSRDAANNEIWLDKKTGMVWSDVLKTDVNWCKAAGNTEAPTTPATTDCNALSEEESLCYNNDSMDGIGNNIAWRLPTRNDYLQADLDGIRFVVKKSAIALWTATINSLSTTRSQAWTYTMTQGTLEVANLDAAKAVRCIGAPRP